METITAIPWATNGVGKLPTPSFVLQGSDELGPAMGTKPQAKDETKDDDVKVETKDSASTHDENAQTNQGQARTHAELLGAPAGSSDDHEQGEYYKRRRVVVPLPPTLPGKHGG